MASRSVAPCRVAHQPLAWMPMPMPPACRPQAHSQIAACLLAVAQEARQVPVGPGKRETPREALRRRKHKRYLRYAGPVAIALSDVASRTPCTHFFGKHLNSGADGGWPRLRSLTDARHSPRGQTPGTASDGFGQLYPHKPRRLFEPSTRCEVAKERLTMRRACAQDQGRLSVMPYLSHNSGNR